MSKDEFMDEELAGMVSYTDETAPAEMPKMERPTHCEKKPCTKSKAMDEEYPPLFTKKRTYKDRLAGCLKWLVPCAVIAMLLWYFQINDLMAMQAAYPCILVCGVLGGFGVGKNVMK